MRRVPNGYWWLKRRGLKNWWKGVHVEFVDPTATYVDPEVEIDNATVIEPGVWIRGKTKIGKNCKIKFGSQIVNSILDDGVEINGGWVINSRLGVNTKVGAFSVIEGTATENDVLIGRHAEIKRSLIGSGTKIPHLSYLGDATIGKKVNIGAGAVTSNYDGEKKNPTVIEDDVFVGTNTDLVAPVTIQKGAMVAAGSTLPANTEVPPGSLVIARTSPHISESKGVVRDEKGWHLEAKENKQ